MQAETGSFRRVHQDSEGVGGKRWGHKWESNETNEQWVILPVGSF